jgi:hypothetical protein
LRYIDKQYAHPRHSPSPLACLPAGHFFTSVVNFRDGNALRAMANIIQVRAIDVENKGIGTTPDEIVSAMTYLFSEEASKISGARIPLY